MPVMRFNSSACADRLVRIYDALAMRGADTPGEKAQAVLERMAEIVRKIGIPADLTAYGVKLDDLEELVQAGLGVQRLLKNNRRIVTAAGCPHDLPASIEVRGQKNEHSWNHRACFDADAGG